MIFIHENLLKLLSVTLGLFCSARNVLMEYILANLRSYSPGVFEWHIWRPPLEIGINQWALVPQKWTAKSAK